jgi:polar amino acid transport system substrate-binding protein
MPASKCFLRYLLLWLLCITSLSHAENARKLISIVADEWCPYTCNPQTSNKQGYLIDIANAVFKPKGYIVDFQLLAWNRAIDESRKGRYSAIAGAYKGDAPDFIFPAHDLGRSTMAFFVRKENPWNYTGINSLGKVTLGLVTGYDYGSAELSDYITRHQNDDKVQLISGEYPLKNNLHKVYLARVDATIDDISVMTYTLRSLGFTKSFRQAGILGRPNSLYIAFSPKMKDSAELANMLSQGIERLRQNGGLQKILSEYGIADWQP